MMSSEQQNTARNPVLLQLGPLPAAPQDDTRSNSDEVSHVDGGLVAQLHALYADRARLHDALGTADAEAIVAMVSSLEAQLVDLYGQRHRQFAPDSAMALSDVGALEVPPNAEAGDDGQA